MPLLVCFPTLQPYRQLYLDPRDPSVYAHVMGAHCPYSHRVISTAPSPPPLMTALSLHFKAGWPLLAIPHPAFGSQPGQ